MRFSQAKFMHQFISKKLPFTFADMWQTNRESMPNRELRNANDLYIPHHNFATLKRMPLFLFPKAWDDELDLKNILSQNLFLKRLKRSLLQTQNSSIFCVSLPLYPIIDVQQTGLSPLAR
jgi:hypothetical protein